MNEENKKKKHKIRIYDLVMALIVTSLGALFFLCVTRSLSGVALLNPWLSAMFCATVFEAILSLFAATVGIKKIMTPIVVIAFLPSVIFLPVGGHMIIVLIAILFTIWGLYNIRRTLFNGLKIDMSTIVRSGISYISFALVLTITSQYYFFTKDNAEILFDASRYVSVSNLVFDQMLKKSNVDNISLYTMTVDQFLEFVIDNEYTQKDEVQDPQIVNNEDSQMIVRWAYQAGINVVDNVEKNIKTNILSQMRVSVSDLVGRDVAGDEMVQDVFAQIISKQINNIISSNTFLDKNKVLIFTTVFFLVVYSLATFVKIVAVWLARFMFMFLRESKVIRVTKTKRDAEVIVF